MAYKQAMDQADQDARLALATARGVIERSERVSIMEYQTIRRYSFGAVSQYVTVNTVFGTHVIMSVPVNGTVYALSVVQMQDRYTMMHHEFEICPHDILAMNRVANAGANDVEIKGALIWLLSRPFDLLMFKDLTAHDRIVALPPNPHGGPPI
jgi:hypothetical protein